MKYAAAALALIVFAAVIYGAGAFVAWDTDASRWNDAGRLLVAVIVVMFGPLAFMAVLDFWPKEKGGE